MHQRILRALVASLLLAASAPAEAQLVRTVLAEVEGGLVTAACGLRGAGPPEAVGQLTVSGIPPGATVLHASLNWVSLGDVSPGPGVRFGLQGSPLVSYVGDAIGVDDSPCWPEHDFAFAHRLDVCDVIAATGNAIYEVALADSGSVSVAPSAEGITLFVVWELPGSPARDIVIYEGAITVDGSIDLREVLDGFDAATPLTHAEVTLVLSDTQAGVDALGRAFVNDVQIADVFDSDDAANCVAPSGRYHDVDTFDVSAIVPAGATSLEVSIIHRSDCYTCTGLAVEIATPTIRPMQPCVADPCAALTAIAEDVTACSGDVVILSGAASRACDGEGLIYHWFDGALELCPPSADPTCAWMAAAGADVRLDVTCDASTTCTRTVRPVLVVEDPPEVDPLVAEDRTHCGDGVRLFWTDATFTGAGTGTYSIYRSTIDCTDALTRPPLVGGLSELEHVDDTTSPGMTYFYVLEAENDTPATGCLPAGPGGGAVGRACTRVTVTSVPFDPNPPDGVYATLRARHLAGQLTLHWETARALLSDEVYRLLQVERDPTAPWRVATLLDPLGTEHVETTLTAPLQFFDLRVLDDCGRMSADEFPPG